MEQRCPTRAQPKGYRRQASSAQQSTSSAVKSSVKSAVLRVALQVRYLHLVRQWLRNHNLLRKRAVGCVSSSNNRLHFFFRGTHPPSKRGPWAVRLVTGLRPIVLFTHRVVQQYLQLRHGDIGGVVERVRLVPAEHLPHPLSRAGVHVICVRHGAHLPLGRALRWCRARQPLVRRTAFRHPAAACCLSSPLPSRIVSSGRWCTVRQDAQRV